MITIFHMRLTSLYFFYITII